jgi:spore coat protein U-like protein
MVNVNPVTRNRWLLALGLLALAGTAGANTCTASATSLAFGSYTPGTGALASAASITVTCNSGAFFAVGASPGNSGNENQRLLAYGTHTLQYNLYLTSAHATIWGDGNGSTGVFSGTATSLPSVFNYYGLLPDNAVNQAAVPGVYSDTIIVVVSF